MNELNSCNVSVRGTYFEINKKVPPGQRKLFLHIEGDSQHKVYTTYKDIKREIEEAAMKNLAIGAGMTGGGKFSF